MEPEEAFRHVDLSELSRDRGSVVVVAIGWWRRWGFIGAAGSKTRFPEGLRPFALYRSSNGLYRAEIVPSAYCGQRNSPREKSHREDFLPTEATGSKRQL